MLDIKDINDADLVWDKFRQKYQNLSPGIDPGKQAGYQRKSVSAGFSQDLLTRYSHYEQAARKIQTQWRKLRSQDTLIKVNPKGNHSSDFNHLLNYDVERNNGVCKSIHQAKLSTLLRAINHATWRDDIFDDPTLPQLALSLFSSGQITQQQIYTQLERHQTFKYYLLIDDYPILNPDGSFSAEAKNYLLPALTTKKILKNLNSQQLNTFRLLVAALPKSEQFFYLTGKGKLTWSKNGNLGETLIRLDAILTNSLYIIHLSSGAREALGLTRFGLDEYIRPMPRLGKQLLSDIEHGVRHWARYAAIYFPNTLPPGNIHDYPNVDSFEARSHDDYHGNVMSTIPNLFLKILHRFVDISRKHVGYQWSKEIWDWIDSDYIYFFLKFNKTPIIRDINITTQYFCEMLAVGNGTSSKLISCGGSLLRNNQPTTLGILIFIDMVKNRSEWLELQIIPKQFINYLKPDAIYKSSFKFYYSCIEMIYEKYLVDEASPHLQVFKIKFFLFLLESRLKNTLKNIEFFILKKEDDLVLLFKEINTMINAEKEDYLSKLTFGKRPKSDSLSNTITLYFDDTPIDEQVFEAQIQKLFTIWDTQSEMTSCEAVDNGTVENELNFEARDDLNIINQPCTKNYTIPPKLLDLEVKCSEHGFFSSGVDMAESEQTDRKIGLNMPYSID